MPSVLTTVPARAIPNIPARVIITPADGAANFVRLWCTVAPKDSAIGKKIAKVRTTTDPAHVPRVLVYQGQCGSSHPWRVTFDKGGVYTLILQSYQRGNGFGGGYTGDPRGAPTETQLGAEETLSLVIGERLEHELGTGGDTATLVLYVFDDTPQRTLFQVHGEQTPAIINPTSDRARAAAGEALVLQALGNLTGDNFLTLLGFGALLTDLQDVQEEFDAHLTSATAAHNANDTDNAITRELVASVSPESLPDVLSQMYLRIKRHLQNDSGAGPGSAAYHRISSEDRIDSKNQPMVTSCTPETMVAMLGDLSRAVGAHVLDTTYHSAADVNNVPAITGTLTTLHAEFMKALAKSELTAAPGQSTLAAKLAPYGFRAA